MRKKINVFHIILYTHNKNDISCDDDLAQELVTECLGPRVAKHPEEHQEHNNGRKQEHDEGVSNGNMALGKLIERDELAKEGVPRV